MSTLPQEDVEKSSHIEHGTPSLTDPPAEAEHRTINESGHTQELHRNFSLLSLAGTGILVGNVWPALGGTILVAIYNGGPPGVLYEFIAASLLEFTVAASVAELASAMPSSAGPYLWASVTPGKRYGRIVGFFAGHWNTLAWIFAAAAMSAICGNLIVQMYAVSHQGFEVKAWHVFVTYLLVSWSACASVCFFNKWMPWLNKIGIFVTVAGVLLTIVIVSFFTSKSDGTGPANSRTVWADWIADIGYPDGFVFVSGMLNGNFAMGTPDSTSHLSEEIPEPSKNVPRAIAMQYITGFVSGLAYLIAILYAITDYDALYASSFPIAEIYHQATGSTAGTIGLLFLLLLPTYICVIALYLTCGRTLWALARDGATPLPNFLSTVHPTLGLPVRATVICCALVTVLGCIYVGSSTAFNAFVGSFILLSTSSYLAAVIPFMLRKRQGIVFGSFRLKGYVGWIVNFVACAFMTIWFAIYCFPYSLPTNAMSMNYTSLIWGGLSLFTAVWWLVYARWYYPGIALPVTQTEYLS